MKKTIDELRAEALQALKEDDGLFVDMVNELDSYNGFADGFRCYRMDELDDLFCGVAVSDFLSKLCNGFDLRCEWFADTIWGLDSVDDITEHYRANVWEDELLDGIIDNAHRLWFSDSDFEELIQAIVDYDEEDEDAA